MTDTQNIRKEISKNCIDLIENKIKKSRLTPDEIQEVIVSEIVNNIKKEF